MLSKTYDLSAHGYTFILEILNPTRKEMKVKFIFTDIERNTQIFEGDLFNHEGYYIHNTIDYIIINNIGLLIEDVDIPGIYYDELHEKIKKIVIDMWNDLHGLIPVQE